MNTFPRPLPPLPPPPPCFVIPRPSVHPSPDNSGPQHLEISPPFLFRVHKGANRDGERERENEKGLPPVDFEFSHHKSDDDGGGDEEEKSPEMKRWGLFPPPSSSPENETQTKDSSFPASFSPSFYFRTFSILLSSFRGTGNESVVIVVRPCRAEPKPFSLSRFCK